MPKKQNRSKLTFLILTIVWIFVIFSFSLQIGSISSLQSGVITKIIASFFSTFNIHIELDVLRIVIRKLAHFTEYFILGCLVKQSSIDIKQSSILYFIFLIPILDEFIQSFVPERVMSIIDMGIDAFGILVGISFISLVYLILKKYRRNKS